MGAGGVLSSSAVGLPEALERAASALPDHADAIRPANGDPVRLAEELDDEAGARVLTWLLEHLLEDAAELVEAWVETPEIGAPPLLRVSPDRLSKAGRKLLRRAQHQLRSRGVEVPEEAPAAVVATLVVVVVAPVASGLSGAHLRRSAAFSPRPRKPAGRPVLMTGPAEQPVLEATLSPLAHLAETSSLFVGQDRFDPVPIRREQLADLRLHTVS